MTTAELSRAGLMRADDGVEAMQIELRDQGVTERDSREVFAGVVAVRGQGCVRDSSTFPATRSGTRLVRTISGLGLR